MVYIMMIVVGTSCRSEESIKSYNVNPEVTLTSHSDGSELSEGFEEIFRAQASDPNHSASELKVSWFYGEEEVCTDLIPNESGSVVCSITPHIDHSEVRVEVRDPLGAAGTSFINISVLPTEAPIVEIFSPVPSGLYYSDQKIQLRAETSDGEDEHSMLEAVWISDIDDVLSTTSPNSEGVVDDAQYLSEGEHYLQLEVTDSTGKTGIESVRLYVRPPNTAPSCSITAPMFDSVFTQGELIVFEASVSDNELGAELLTVEWVSDKDGVLGSSQPTSQGDIVFGFSDLSVNAHSISINVLDEAGATCSDLIFVSIGTPPDVQIQTPTSGDIFTQGDPVIIEALVTDAQDASSDIQLDWVLDGVSVSNLPALSSGAALIQLQDLLAGSHNMQLLATDTQGLTSSDLVSFVVDGPPTQPVVDIQPNPVYTVQDIQANASGSTDPEGSVISYTYRWFKDGALSTHMTSTLPASATQKGETWSVQVTPSDGISQGPYGEASIVVSNSTPSISSIQISPATPVISDTIQCSAVAVDEDDGSLTATYEWSNQSTGVVVGSGTSLSLDAVIFDTGDVIECTATATDDEGVQVTSSTTVVIQNSAPEINSIEVSPLLAYTQTTLSTTTQSTDPDGDTVNITYEWHVSNSSGDTVVQSGSTSTLDGAPFSKGDAVYVVVEGSDGFLTSSSETSNTITIQNSAPSIDSIVVTPNPAIDDEDDLTCTITMSDADSDTVDVTYVWTDSSGTVSLTEGPTSSASSTLPMSTTLEGSWTCTVTPNDGVIDGASAQESTLVEPGCLYGEVDCPGSSCDDILNSGGSVGSGVYYIDPDGQGAFDVYCLMETQGWTLLLSADGDSTYWGNNSPYWSQVGSDAAPTGLVNTDHHSPAYDRMGTEEIKMCLNDDQQCHTFDHQLGISLYDFFVTGTTYTEFSYRSIGHSDTGSASALSQFESDMGHSVSRHQCQWLGINDTNSISAIGYLADGNGGCSHLNGSYGHHDDAALGVGLQSCMDANSCYKGGSGHKAGRTRSIDGVDDSGVFGPWFVFGR